MIQHMWAETMRVLNASPVGRVFELLERDVFARDERAHWHQVGRVDTVGDGRWRAYSREAVCLIADATFDEAITVVEIGLTSAAETMTSDVLVKKGE